MEALRSGRELFPERISPAAAAIADWLRENQRARWHRGERVLAEDYLRHQPNIGQSVIRELVVGEVALREEAGESIHSRDFVQRFPQLIEGPPTAGGTICPEPIVRIAPAAHVALQNGYEILEELGQSALDRPRSK